MERLLVLLGEVVSKYINYFIILCAVGEYIAYRYSKKKKDYIKSEINKWEKENNLSEFDENGKILNSYDKLNLVYTIFIALISIFPLLGMLGTVSSLLTLDTKSPEALNSAKDGFFTALSSTFLGIIAAIFFKAVNAFKMYDIEDVTQRLSKVINILRQESIDESKKQNSGWRV